MCVCVYYTPNINLVFWFHVYIYFFLLSYDNTCVYVCRAPEGERGGGGKGGRGWGGMNTTILVGTYVTYVMIMDFDRDNV